MQSLINFIFSFSNVVSNNITTFKNKGINKIKKRNTKRKTTHTKQPINTIIKFFIKFILINPYIIAGIAYSIGVYIQYLDLSIGCFVLVILALRLIKKKIKELQP